MNIFPRPKLFSVSPVLLAAATALLVLIIVTFTFVNIRREEQLMTDSMLQKADTLIRIIHSGSRSAYMADLRRDAWGTGPWQAYVQQVLLHVAEDPDVKFLAIVDESSKVIVHNDNDQIGLNLDFTLPQKPVTGQDNIPPIGYRITSLEKEGRVFEAVRQFFPYRPLLQSKLHNSFLRRQGRVQLNERGLMLRKMRQDHPAEMHEGGVYYVLVGLDMSSYDTSLRRIKLQTMILSIVMLLVGLGGWLSLAAVQGYRVSQKTLAEMKLFTNLLLAKLPVGIIATDREGYITTFNESAARMTGVPSGKGEGKKTGAVLPQPFAELFHVLDNEKSGMQMHNGLEKEITLHRDGTEQHFLCHMISVEGGASQQQGVVVLISDLTQLKGLEKEMRENERLAAVGRMAAAVAHEVRNPLSSIKGLALLLKGKISGSDNDKEAANLLVEQVERMNRTVSELLSFARPAPLDLQKVSVAVLLRDTLRLLETDAGNQGVSTRLIVEDGIEDIAADPDRLSQVFINLLLNGMQAMPEGGELTVTAENCADGKRVKIEVRDTGCGIPQQNLSQLFYPYFTTKAGGTGIGLAISQKIVNDHKGTIKIDSVEGDGTVVTVLLPVFKTDGDSGY